jgi:hypothetical protein
LALAEEASFQAAAVTVGPSESRLTYRPPMYNGGVSDNRFPCSQRQLSVFTSPLGLRIFPIQQHKSDAQKFNASFLDSYLDDQQ